MKMEKIWFFFGGVFGLVWFGKKIEVMQFMEQINFDWWSWIELFLCWSSTISTDQQSIIVLMMLIFMIHCGVGF